MARARERAVEKTMKIGLAMYLIHMICWPIFGRALYSKKGEGDVKYLTAVKWGLIVGATWYLGYYVAFSITNPIGSMLR